MELTCFEVIPGRVELRPAPRRRPWMDEAPHSYHCLPLVTANQHGWEILCPFALDIEWRGGPHLDDVQIVTETARAPELHGFTESHFGSGIVTFNPLLILRTAPGFNLWISGPVNSFKDGIAPLSASVEADWMPFTFSMNWKITRPHARIHFDAGEPFCSFFPVQRGVVSACEPRLVGLDHVPELREQYQWAGARRALDEQLGQRERDTLQGWYLDGEMPKRAAGSAPADHEKKITPKPFTR